MAHAQQLSSKALTTRVTAFIVLLEKRRVAIQNLVYFRTDFELGLSIYSGLAPEARTTFPHFAVSLLMNAANCSGVDVVGSKSPASMRSR
jgi:hypothetical protein